MKTWLFWDLWHIEHQDNVELCQGRPKWVPEATYEDPTFDYLGCWPRVWRDEGLGRWLMVYPASGFPMTLMGAESDDGIRWQAMDRQDIQPPGEKYAPNHLFTVARANGGPAYLDALATDGYRFKCYCVQRGGPAAGRAKLEPGTCFHEIVGGEGAKAYLAENLALRSKDGLHWEIDEGGSWTLPHWHPDPPLNAFYDARRRRHVLVTRPGWGDRRVAMLTSEDARTWSDLEVVLQPDPTDPPQVQFYGMPVHPYEGAFVGFLWLAHFSNAGRLRRFNQLWGPVDSQLAYSFDGRHWQRGLRESFIPLNEPGQIGSGVIYPTCMVEHGDELRIYSVGTHDLHHQYAATQFTRKGEGPAMGVILHTLRKDGFMCLASRGNWARFVTKPLVLREPVLSMNVQAPHGEVVVQLTDLASRPLEGFTFDDCMACREQDTLAWDVGWKARKLEEVTGRIVRLEVRFRHARIYAFRGDFHFADALDVELIEDGKPIAADFLDF